ncbi:C4-dicarboxylate TRAP transporter substrate-binding protein [Pollutimonas bauzanensis]|uniref:TRAP-type C4-dicarboxylate transport system, substrate-binding protein n=1 Tax=Pollutimonas bauzanensis TaxID=658167 RepID=A0A1M5QG50_9BURK|nr:C4-dicarboxylate TRAP transporter substrate-binding protein [Pollutimonas bauzanensis]SHH13042.1 TRAP-type C4-dicarboxylate transport system, substrate-binding protein [Pollutimonas bauzanensis]
MKHASTLRRVGAALLTLAMLPPAAAMAQGKTFRLTIASSHPTTLPWVGLMSTVFVPEVTKRVEALGKGYRVQWQEAYGGQLYKMNATLTSVEQGVTDIGWVFHNLEAAKMPLAQFGTVTPFTTDDIRVILDVANELNETMPALRAEWERNNTVFLGATGVDTYHLFTKAPVKAYADIAGRRISAPGSIGLWLRGSNAVAIDGSLTSYYTDIQTGVSDGVISIATGILPNRIYEVAPYVTTVGIGGLYIGGIAINKDTWDGLPPEVQQIVKDVGKEYSRVLGETLMERYEAALTQMAELGAAQNPPVAITPLPPQEREAWIRTMPNLAADWVKANGRQGAAAKDIVIAYMNALRKRGVTPARNWDQEL